MKASVITSGLAVLLLEASQSSAFVAPSKAFASINNNAAKIESSDGRDAHLSSGLPSFSNQQSMLSTNIGSSKLHATAGSSTRSDAATSMNATNGTTGKIIFLLPHNASTLKSKFGSRSPYGNPSILEATEQLRKKASWFSDGAVEAEIVILPQEENASVSLSNDVNVKIENADALIAFQLESNKDLNYVKQVFGKRRKTRKDDRCHFALDCGADANNGADMSPICGPYDPSAPSVSSEVLPWTSDASGKRLIDQMNGLFDRWTSDDFTYAIMLFFNQFASSTGEIDWVKHSIDATWEKGLVQNGKELYDMVTKCGDCVAKCVQDETCKKCLDELTAVDTSDQVASYRTIVSFESELLKEFSFCILQKNNIFNCDAKIPKMPYVEPMKEFRGKPLTKEVARGILVGHLDDEKAMDGSERTDISWKVGAGANVAYDQFPSQNQIFYESANGKSMWYDPVFRVETIDGRNVWANRHYRVREEAVPGTFRFSVLDNGVTSDEFWTIVDCADDLSHIVFHYAGAAGAVGQRYLGGLLCTADGTLPAEEHREPIYEKLRSAGIEPWELFECDNRMDSEGAMDAGPPPLEFFRKEVLQRKRELKEKI